MPAPDREWDCAARDNPPRLRAIACRRFRHSPLPSRQFFRAFPRSDWERSASGAHNTKPKNFLRRHRLAQSQERLLAAEFRVEGVMVDNVVAVRTAGAGLEKRGGVKMTDTERLEVRHDTRGIVEAEAGREL